MATSTIQQVTNNSGSGYCKMPDGTLIQWGGVEFPDAQVGNQNITVTLPLKYSSSTYCVVVSWNDNPNAISDYFKSLSVHASKAASYFVVGAYRIHTDYLWRASWIAIGRWK